MNCQSGQGRDQADNHQRCDSSYALPDQGRLGVLAGEDSLSKGGFCSRGENVIQRPAYHGHGSDAAKHIHAGRVLGPGKVHNGVLSASYLHDRNGEDNAEYQKQNHGLDGVRQRYAEKTAENGKADHNGSAHPYAGLLTANAEGLANGANGEKLRRTA